MTSEFFWTLYIAFYLATRFAGYLYLKQYYKKYPKANQDYVFALGVGIVFSVFADALLLLLLVIGLLTAIIMFFELILVKHLTGRPLTK